MNDTLQTVILAIGLLLFCFAIELPFIMSDIYDRRISRKLKQIEEEDDCK